MTIAKRSPSKICCRNGAGESGQKNMENKEKEYYSIKDLSFETRFSVVWIHKLVEKLQLKPEIFSAGEAGHELILPKEEAMKIIRYAKKQQNIQDKRRKNMEAA